MAIRNRFPLAVSYDNNNDPSGFAEFEPKTTDLSDIGDTTPSTGQVLTWTDDGKYQPQTPTGGGGGAVNSVNDQTGDVSLYLSSLSGISFDKLGGDTGEGGGLLPQHLQWNGTNWINAYEDEQYIRIKNRSGSELKAGQVVHIFNFQGDQAEVSLARADSSSTMPSIGVVYANILTDETGLAVTFGTADVDNSLTIDGSPNVGDILYVSPTTSGSLTAIKPTGSSHLIQNVGVLLKAGSGAKVKVTGVGRANDIPNTITLGATTITSASAKFANVDADHVLISTATSAISSVASSTLLSNYYTRSEADGQFLEETTNLTGIADVTGTPDANYILKRNSENSNWDPVTMNAALLATGERVEDHNIEDLANVASDTTFIDGHVLVYQEGDDGAGFTPFASSIFGGGVDATDHGSLIGLGDDDHTQYVLSAGTRSMSALTVNNETTTKDIKVTRLGQGRPTNFTWTSDYLTPRASENGWYQSLGSGGSIGADSIMLNEYQDVAGIISLGVNANTTARATMFTNNDTLYASGQAWSFATRACMQSASVAGATYSGVIGVANSATDYNLPGYGVYFLCGHGGGNWIARTSGQFGNTETDTGVALSSYTLSVLQIMCNEDWTKAEFYIDGSSVATHTTNLPNRIDNTGFLYKLWNNGEATAGGKMYVDWHDIKIISTSVDRGEGHIKDFSDFTP